ncbi:MULTISPECIES: hypothetical protein [Alkalimonas]|uniref:Uncharacterized protein n=1 Tax=Alkalimonas mucilaginosa TaxID=3057676 RepID=A0ABU7JF60_9GAMM|nr:hypothetical protein [Alkalimonas sp. MEB004]MEE2024285.1 hypothetical protein [Alkalimonas sp. MEB004]
MKKLLFILLVILLLATFSDHPRVSPYKEWLFQQFYQMAGLTSRSGEAQALRNIDRLFAELGQELGEGQRAQLQRAASSKQELLLFRQRYCIDGDFNPLLFGEPLRKACGIIDSQYDILMRH